MLYSSFTAFGLFTAHIVELLPCRRISTGDAAYMMHCCKRS
jgi:hypothetical protein